MDSADGPPVERLVGQSIGYDKTPNTSTRDGTYCMIQS